MRISLEDLRNLINGILSKPNQRLYVDIPNDLDDCYYWDVKTPAGRYEANKQYPKPSVSNLQDDWNQISKGMSDTVQLIQLSSLLRAMGDDPY
jgi:hypothetical protein